MISTTQKQTIAWAQQPGMGMLSVGPIRSGKTFASSLGFGLYTQSLDKPYLHLIVGRKLRVVEKEILPHLHKVADICGIKSHYRKTEQTLHMGKQIYYVLAGNDDRSMERMTGLTCHSLLADECIFIPENFLNTAVSRLTFPDSKGWLACNPGSPNHWIKKKWVDLDGSHSFLNKTMDYQMDDNPILGDEVKRRYSGMFSGVFHRRMILGEWAAGEGLIWPDVQIREIRRFSLDNQNADGWRTRRVDIGVDYGPASVSAFVPLETIYQASTGETKYFVPYTVHVEGGNDRINKTDSQLAEILIELALKTKAQSVVVDPSASSFRAELVKSRRRQFSIRQANNDVIPGLRLTGNALQKGTVIISPKSTHLIDEIEAYQWDETKEDTPVKANDHHCDALRYIVMDRVRKTQGVPIELNVGGL